MYASDVEESVSQTRAVKINIRAKPEERDLIDCAARIQGKNRSEFMIESAYQKAQDILLDQCFFGLDETKFNQFQEILDAPPKWDERLHSLLTTKAPWDSDADSST